RTENWQPSLPALLPLSYSVYRMSGTGERFERAVSIMARQRGPGGCAWDREQTFDSIKPYTLDETYEVLEAVDNRDLQALTAESVLAGVSPGMPALLEAHKLSSRAAHVGFDWPNIEGLFEKLAEEISELRSQLERFPQPGPQPSARGFAGSGRQPIAEQLRARLEEEVGDLFFVLVIIARYLSLDPESALKKTNRKF